MGGRVWWHWRIFSSSVLTCETVCGVYLLAGRSECRARRHRPVRRPSHCLSSSLRYPLSGKRFLKRILWMELPWTFWKPLETQRKPLARKNCWLELVYQPTNIGRDKLMYWVALCPFSPFPEIFGILTLSLFGTKIRLGNMFFEGFRCDYNWCRQL